MMWKTGIFTAAMLAVLALAPGAQPVAWAACDAGDKIDNSTAASAKQKIEGAGYSNVHDLKKACDNFWHALATKDGTESHVAVSPQGKVIPEGD